VRITSIDVPGCLEIQSEVFRDRRGTFVKVLQEEVFRRRGLATRFAEEYYSSSRKGVLRGLHFQLPPHDHVKLVHCVLGRVFDAIVDLRRGSPTYGRHLTLDLSAEKANLLYLPAGIAHGFCVLSPSAIVMYRVTTVHAPDCDTGILWNSVGIPWPVERPILSERDRSFPRFEDFRSPFVFTAAEGA
jgi:dTDP-4-dehydrorhamnose 3,5-epimerase